MKKKIPIIRKSIYIKKGKKKHLLIKDGFK